MSVEEGKDNMNDGSIQSRDRDFVAVGLRQQISLGIRRNYGNDDAVLGVLLY